MLESNSQLSGLHKLYLDGAFACPSQPRARFKVKLRVDYNSLKHWG